VDVRLGGGADGGAARRGLRIGVRGTARPLDGGGSGGEAAPSLEIVFTEWSLSELRAPAPFLRLPLPRPVGRLDTTFCDATLRLSRGGRGGLFVLSRIRDRAATGGAAAAPGGADAPPPPSRRGPPPTAAVAASSRHRGASRRRRGGAGAAAAATPRGGGGAARRRPRPAGGWRLAGGLRGGATAAGDDQRAPPPSASAAERPRNIIVVGGSSGMGAAAAAAALRRGGRVLLASRSAEKLARASAALGGGAAADRVETAVLDASDEAAVERFAAALRDGESGGGVEVRSHDVSSHQDGLSEQTGRNQPSSGILLEWDGLVVSCAGRAPHGSVAELPTADTREVGGAPVCTPVFAHRSSRVRPQQRGV